MAEARLEPVYEVVDRLEREPQSRLAERLADLGLAAEVIEGIFRATRLRGIAELRREFGGVASVAERIDELDRYLDHLADLGVAEFVDVDLSVVRGLAYYTGIVFELWDARRELRAICGGGRYDDLLQLVAGMQMPALGFGMGDVVLVELLNDHALLPEPQASLDCFVAWLGAEARRRALQAAQSLRAAGLSAVYEFGERRLGNQLKSADAVGARWAVIIGPQEVEAGEARVRDMASGDERVLTLGELAGALASQRGEGRGP